MVSSQHPPTLLPTFFNSDQVTTFFNQPQPTTLPPATLDAEKLSKYFFRCPVFVIPGRMYLVYHYPDVPLITVMQIHLRRYFFGCPNPDALLITVMQIHLHGYFFRCPIFTMPCRTYHVEILYTKEPESNHPDAPVMRIHLRGCFFGCPIFTIPGCTFPVEIFCTKEPESDYLDAPLQVSRDALVNRLQVADCHIPYIRLQIR
ncbi:hypothetical protein DFJ58DRAFT_722554 [Suillus subalutaceus]|uniref:uncharacterized protein n=1 Tax=Suillus subalutaceus TaxID=48586 RepID=UPI001B881269|nr:uncharacterized protein DFJ58DRAFT_722554 [Suillus subalutaceus]KAG1871807.1 hypothetical protein DFJ58DRAFT_722554 [Suillus subalutaceus]